jgi:release factor glutamine methyltransferase
MADDNCIGDLLEQAAARLAASSESPRLDAEILLARAIDMPRSYLFAHPDDTLDEGAIRRLEQSMARREALEPLAYIVGHKEFWSLQLMVTADTLVPRPETELLVELALGDIPRNEKRRVLDLGTGSGAIALAIGKERPLASIVATDASEAALRVARQNARQLDIDNVEFVHGDWTTPLSGAAFDLIVSNPPYVKCGDPALAALGHEPIAALAAGPDGLDAIRTLAKDCAALLVAGGKMLLEHGGGQQAEVSKILQDNGWSEITCTNDYAGLPRVSAARKPALRSDL